VQEKSHLDKQAKADLLYRLNVKEDQLDKVSMVASGLAVNTTIEDPTLVQNGHTSVKVTVQNNGNHHLKRVNIHLDTPDGWNTEHAQTIKMLKPGEKAEKVFEVKVPSDANYYQPYDPPVIQPVVSYKVKNIKVSQTYNP